MSDTDRNVALARMTATLGTSSSRSSPMCDYIRSYRLSNGASLDDKFVRGVLRTKYDLHSPHDLNAPAIAKSGFDHGVTRKDIIDAIAARRGASQAR